MRKTKRNNENDKKNDSKDDERNKQIDNEDEAKKLRREGAENAALEQQ